MNNKDFILFADLPPSPLDDNQINDYLGLGFNVVLLTEDDVKMIKENQLSNEYVKAIKNLSKYDVNIWIRNMYNDADYFDCSNLDKRRSNYGVPYILTERHLTDEFKKFDKVTGFYMADEPFCYQLNDSPEYASFDQLTKLVEFRNKYYKNYYFHMNMVPSSSYDHYYMPGNKLLNYRDFIDEYIKTIVSKVECGNKSICLDSYPFIGDKYIEPIYLGDLLTVANATRDYNQSVNNDNKATFGICVQTFECYSALRDRHRDIILPSEISFQVLVGLCLNAHLFEYFAFRSLNDGSILGILDQYDKKRIYDIVEAGNSYSFKFFDYIKDYEWLGADFYYGYVREFSNPVHVHKDLFYKNHPYIKDIKSEYDVLLGCFYNKDSYAFLIVNYTDPQKNHLNKIEVTLDNVYELSIYDGDELKNIKCNQFEYVLNIGKGVFVSFKK